MIDRRSLIRAISLVGAIGGHMLLIVILADTFRRDHKPVASAPQDRIKVFFLELPTPDPLLPDTVKRAARRSLLSSSPSSTLAQPSENTPRPTSPERAVDWYREAEEVARETDLRALAREQFGCAPTHGKGPLPPRCKKRDAYRWDPEPKRAGFAGGIPYVRLGKRCVAWLGGFGCALDKPPKAGSDLYERMHDPDRPTSSVPDLPDEPLGDPSEWLGGPRLDFVPQAP